LDRIELAYKKSKGESEPNPTEREKGEGENKASNGRKRNLSTFQREKTPSSCFAKKEEATFPRPQGVEHAEKGEKEKEKNFDIRRQKKKRGEKVVGMNQVRGKGSSAVINEEKKTRKKKKDLKSGGEVRKEERGL